MHESVYAGNFCKNSKLKKPKCLSIAVIWTKEYHIAMKMKESQPHVPTEMNLRNLMISERNKSQNNRNNGIPSSQTALFRDIH